MTKPSRTKFVLIGGLRTHSGDGGHALSRELVKGYAEPVKILIVLFARERDAWDESYRHDQAFFARTLPHAEYEIQLAQVDTFADQVKWADVIYMKGGTSTPMILEALNRDRSWTGRLDGKTLAGSSCGAYVICRYFSQLDPPLTSEGLGLIPYKVLAHWQSPDYGNDTYWKHAYAELDNFADKLPIITLREGEFKVIET